MEGGRGAEILFSIAHSGSAGLAVPVTHWAAELEAHCAGTEWALEVYARCLCTSTSLKRWWAAVSSWEPFLLLSSFTGELETLYCGKYNTDTAIPFLASLVFGFLWAKWCPSAKNQNYLVVINACSCAFRCVDAWDIAVQPGLCWSGRRMWSIVCSYLHSMWLLSALSCIADLLPNRNLVPLSVSETVKPK